MGSADIPGPHRRGQTILRIVGPRQRLLLIAERGDADHRAKHLALDNIILLLRPGQQRRLVVVAFPRRSAAAGHHFDMRQRARGVDGGAHPIEVRLRADRPQLRRAILRRADFQAGNGGPQFLHQLVINALLSVDAAGGGTVLAGVIETEGPHALHHRVNIRVVKDDNRRLTAQLHMRTLNRGGRMANDMRAGGYRSGQRDHPHLMMAGQRIANGFAAAKQHVEDAGREDVFCQLGQLQRS